MAEIKLNAEVLNALQGCKDAKDVVALAKSNGIDLSEEKAGKLLKLVQNDKLSNEELDMVGGGCHVCICWTDWF